MAVKFLDNLDLNDNQLLNARLQNLASDPGSANAGDIIYNSTSNVLKFYNGSAWVDPSTGSYTSWTVTADNGASVAVNDGATVDWAGGTGITTSYATPSGSRTVTTSLDNTAVTAGSYTSADITVDAQGRITAATSGGSYTKWIADGGSSTVQDVNDGDTYKPEESTTRPGIFADAVTKVGTVVTQPLSLFTKNMTTAAPSDFSTSVLLWGDDASASSWKVQKTHIDDVAVSAFGDATTTVDMGGNKILDVATPTVSTDAANKAYVDANAGTTYTIPVSNGTNAANINLTDNGGTIASTVVVSGTTNETTVGNLASGNITIGLPNDVTLTGDLTVSGGDITLGSTGRIQGVDTVSASTDAANKAYVDSAVVGNLIFQGGYDAATNTPDLDSSPSSSIKKGWSYVVTADGSFFTEQVRVGDFLIAQQDAPTTLANWVTVQNNIDLATLSTVGIGNVNESAEIDRLGMEVLYSNGTASIGLDIVGLTAGTDVVDNDEFVIYDLGTTTNKKVRASRIKSYLGIKGTFAGTSASGTSHVFTHNLGTDDVIVQIFDASTKETVYATVDRTSTNAVTVTTAASANIRCVITEC